MQRLLLLVALWGAEVPRPLHAHVPAKLLNTDPSQSPLENNDMRTVPRDALTWASIWAQARGSMAQTPLASAHRDAAAASSACCWPQELLCCPSAPPRAAGPRSRGAISRSMIGTWDLFHLPHNARASAAAPRSDRCVSRWRAAPAQCGSRALLYRPGSAAIAAGRFLLLRRPGCLTAARP
jgi:hypothetical protein